MYITSELLTADRDQVFADWGETVTLKQIAQAYDPDSQQISESETELSLTAIVGTQPTVNVADAGGQLQTVDLVLQIRTEDWATDAGDVTWRAIVKNQTYDVVGQAASPGSRLVELHCRKLGNS